MAEGQAPMDIPTLAAIACVTLFVIYKIFSRRSSSAPPTAKIGIPLIGNYIEFAKNPVSFIYKCQEKFGDVYTVPMLHKNLTFLLGPEVSAPFYQLSDDAMSQSEVYGFMKPVFGEGVVYDAEPKKRLQQMQNMSKGLRSGNLEAYVAKIEMETIEYLKRWGDKGEVNMLDALSELTILSSSRCLHGDDVRENLFAEVAEIYHDLDKGVTPLSFFFPYAPTAAHAKRDAARLKMTEIFSKVIKARKLKPKTETGGFTDILQVFVDMHYKDGSTLPDDHITGLLIALLFAGQHTSSITSTWTAMYLLHHPDCLAKVMAEQDSVLGKGASPSSKIDFETVANMEYLQNCVKESLRLQPPLIMLMRQAMVDVPTTLNGKKYIIPKGDIVITSPAVSSRMESVFKNCNDFVPDRFVKEEFDKLPPYSYLGFGGGRHACLGQQFGLLQVKTVISVLLRNFKLEPTTTEFPEPDYTAMVVGPKNHCTVKYTKLPNSTI